VLARAEHIPIYMVALHLTVNLQAQLDGFWCHPNDALGSLFAPSLTGHLDILCL